MTNRLANETSPYLLQHANNPVDWYPWGQEALEKARHEDKPIFLSVGYAACHWCHVMERESFEDPEIAALMNKYFINIKVDREERPDLDGIYMSATVAMTGSGGWPLSVFLTPELKPFFAGTYFPPTPRYNLPSFRDVLIAIADVWKNKREQLIAESNAISHYLQSQKVYRKSQTDLSLQCLETAVQNLRSQYDWEYGGWGKAPKFPQPVVIEFLLRRATRGDQQALQMALHALDAMAKGGMYDIVGGGFARYSVDHRWHIPHFEKMLYDNAQLTLTYLHAYLISGENRYREVCEQTLEFLTRELYHPEGGFYSSLDADSEGEEGKFYTWTTSELRAILNDDFALFQAAHQITEEGNWESKVVLQRMLDNATLAEAFGMDEKMVQTRLNDCYARLFTYRNKRIAPAIDDKVITYWNCLTIIAFAEAGRYLKNPQYLNVARCCAQFLIENLYVDGKLYRSWRNGRKKNIAYLEDYAGFILALLSLYQSDYNIEWYSLAMRLTEEIIAHFSDPNGGFFDTRDDHETLLYRPKNMQDSPTPCGNSLAATALITLTSYGDLHDQITLVEDMISAVLKTATNYPTAFAQWLCAADFALGPVQQVVLLGNRDHPQMQAMLDELWKSYRPRTVVAISPYPPTAPTPSLLQNRPLKNGQPTAYVCNNFVCHQPVNDPLEMSRQLTTT